MDYDTNRDHPGAPVIHSFRSDNDIDDRQCEINCATDDDYDDCPSDDEILDWMFPDEDSRAEYDEDGIDYDD